MKIPNPLCLLFSLVIASATSCQAGIWLPNIFGDHMVLQAEKPIAVWGKANAGESVTVELLDAGGAVLASASPVTAAADKTWSVVLPEVAAGLSGSLRITGSESGERILTDVLTGEVWLCSGQSNMRWTVAKSANAEEEIAAADHPEIRLFLVDLNPASAPSGNLPGKWVVCSPETVGDFSGAGYFFGRDLHKALGIPVGLICSAVGGTPIQAWTPLEAMEAHPATTHLQDNFVAYYEQPPEKRRKARGTSIYGAKNEHAPAHLYNGMIHPLIPLALRGIAWCQGEANSKPGGGAWDGPEVYRAHFPMMIEAWRKAWADPNLPFFYVELASYRDPQKTPVSAEEEHHWGPIREAQAVALDLPNVFPVSTIDLGEAGDIHYKNKQMVGQRLSRAALGAVYDKAEAPSLSPRHASHAVEGNKIRIRLHDADGLKTDDGKPPASFAIRGADTDWRWAETAIDGTDILAWHPDITAPVAVRHAWASNPDVNVYNAAGLPLMPFRTDQPE